MAGPICDSLPLFRLMDAMIKAAEAHASDSGAQGYVGSSDWCREQFWDYLARFLACADRCRAEPIGRNMNLLAGQCGPSFVWRRQPASRKLNQACGCHYVEFNWKWFEAVRALPQYARWCAVADRVWPGHSNPPMPARPRG